MGKRSRDTSFSPAEDSPLPSMSKESSDTESSHHEKYIVVDDILASDMLPEEVMKCALPPHKEPVTFQSFEEYDVHYAKEHTNRCSSCGRNFPTTHFLNLHIEENHDALREALQAKGGKTYGCFVEGCEKKCSTPQKRRLHLIDKHLFPKVYNFRIVDTGIDNSASMLRVGQRRRLSTNNASPLSYGHRHRESVQTQGMKSSPISSTSRETSNVDSISRAGSKDQSTHVQGNEIQDLESSMSVLRFVPTSVLRSRAKKKP